MLFGLFILFFVSLANRSKSSIGRGINLISANTMSAETNNSDDQILYLPEPSKDTNYKQISIGETVSMEELGPIIINSDGTTRRISNWANLTKQEQLNTWRLISSRNKKRIESLKRQEQEEAEIANKQEENIAEENKDSACNSEGGDESK